MNIGSDWKSTAAGVLSGIVGTATTVTAFLSPYLISSPASTQAKLTYVSAACTLLALVGRVWIGVITQNASAPAVAAVLTNVAQTSLPGSPVITAADIVAAPKR